MSAPLPVGRLAPSPTGLLHLGHARTFLLAWWHVRARGGRILLRMEDLDASRVKPGMAGDVLRDLEWLGLDWDGPVDYQSAATEGYERAFARLAAQGLLYPCVCTRKEIELALSAPHDDDGTRAYPGTCRGRFASADEARDATGREPALRFRVPPGRTRIQDGLAPPLEEDVAATVGDFPVRTRDGTPAYQLAVVVDDARQGVTEVLRGADLLPSTARQALLCDALDLPRPQWYHAPLVLDASGRRLAKRADDLSLAALRAAGVGPRAVSTWAARSAGIELTERIPAAACIDLFRLERLSASPVRLPADPVASLLAPDP